MTVTTPGTGAATDAQTDAQFLADFADRWLAAWNSHDTERVLELLSDDIRWDDRTFWPEVIEGKEGVRAYTDKIWEAMPDVQFAEIQRFFAPDARRGIVLFRQTGHGPAKLNPERTFDAHGCDIFLEFSGDRLSSYLSAYDIVPMLQQLGGLPPRDGKLGGAYLISLARGGRGSGA
jgi:steroid delta-isomerase-like uncharacterized protein